MIGHRRRVPAQETQINIENQYRERESFPQPARWRNGRSMARQGKLRVGQNRESKLMRVAPESFLTLPCNVVAVSMIKNSP
jgi:hypothetical protein